MDLSEYKQKSVYIVELDNRYAVEEFLLGKHFTIRVSENCALEVVIPTVYRKDYFDDIGMPEMLPKYGLDIEKWGKIDNYQPMRKLTKHCYAQGRLWLIMKLECLTENII